MHVPRSTTGERVWKNKADFFRPFRAAAAAEAAHSNPRFDPTLPYVEQDEPDLKDLNVSLAALVDVFPDVQPEVFREMLACLSGESRLQVVTEHLLQKKAQWVQGRYRSSMAKDPLRPQKCTSDRRSFFLPHALPQHEHFRRESYRKAVKQLVYQEFKTLNRSTIKAVLAERNFSYTSARPILQQLSARTWRYTITNFWTRRAPNSTLIDHPNVFWEGGEGDDEQSRPVLRQTEDAELDRELYDLLIAPVTTKLECDRLRADLAFASRINDIEARDAGTLFDCECCYSAVSFERVAICSTGQHFLCLECIRRTVKEAIYGQGWARTTDLERATVRCFAPTSHECSGCIPGVLVRRALWQEAANDELWKEFQIRITRDALTRSQTTLHHCPFCEYAELDEVPTPVLKHPFAIIRYFATKPTPSTQIILILLLAAVTLFVVPIICIVSMVSMAMLIRGTRQTAFERSWSRVFKRRRGLKFTCRHPECSATSCSQCSALWRDPHTCFESEKTSLRKAIEASATAAVKRTCPKCMLSFVKSSGCNKLVCNCGYAMCYICRQEITSREGYAHFCQHFRPNGGRCDECDRCDLYGDEDEEQAIRSAARAAEQAWKEKDEGGGFEDQATQQMIDTLVGQVRGEKWHEIWMDRVLDVVIL